MFGWEYFNKSNTEIILRIYSLITCINNCQWWMSFLKSSWKVDTLFLQSTSYSSLDFNKYIVYRNRFVTQYITYLNIREALSGTLSPLSTHDIVLNLQIFYFQQDMEIERAIFVLYDRYHMVLRFSLWSSALVAR